MSTKSRSLALLLLALSIFCFFVMYGRFQPGTALFCGLGLFLCVPVALLQNRNREELRYVIRHLDELQQEGRIDLIKDLGNNEAERTNPLTNTIRTFIKSMRSLFLKIQGNLHQFTFNFYRLERQLRAFFKSFSIISEKIGEGAESGQVISDAVSTQQVSFNEILRTAQELARLASEMDESVSVVNDGAGTGKAKLTNMKQTFDQVTEQTSLLAAKSRTLSERTDVIQSVVGSITNIADQTNLLALNASIEAARAGEAGRGFAVVAEEVKKLADESKEATTKVSDCLNALVEEVQETTHGVENMSTMIHDTASTIHDVTAEIETVLTGIVGISNSSQQVAAGAAELDASAVGLAATSETVTTETTRTKEILSSIEGQLRKLIVTAKDLEATAKAGSKDASESISVLRLIKVMTPTDFVEMTRGAIEAHKAWIDGLKKSLETGEISVETDPTRCRFGIFLSFVERPKEVTDEIWRKTIQMHKDFHNYGHKMETALESDDHLTATHIYKEAEALSTLLIKSLHQIIELCR